MPALTSRATSRRTSEHVLPFAFLAVATMVVVVVLPTTLRPPPDPATGSAPLQPNTPPDDEEPLTILNRGLSATAGVGAAVIGAEGLNAIPAPQVAVDDRPARSRRCFGNPPRQTESIYSAPCAPAWTGDNGGATAHNVSRGEIRIGVWHSNGTPAAGPVPDRAQPNEGAPARTLRVLQAYFNERFETYGRLIRLYALPGGESPEQARSAAVVADTEWKLFAIRDIRRESCAESTRRGLISFCVPAHRDDHEAASPYRWSWMIDRTAIDGLSAEYMCKKLTGRPASFAPDPLLSGAVRKLGLIIENSPQRIGRPAVLARALQQECDARLDVVIEIASRQDPASVGTAITRLKSEAVTSVVLDANFVIAVQAMAAADGQAYEPEWLLFASSGLDWNTVGQLLPPSQMRSLFGLSAWELPRPRNRDDCFVAYRSIDPDNDPAADTCAVHFPDLLQIMNGVQAAGPNLTPEAFRDGLRRVGYRWPAEPWAIGGGYGPGDWTYQDDVGEIWWDPAAIAPENEQPGAYRWVRSGVRFQKGEFPREDPLVFRDGVTSG